MARHPERDNEQYSDEEAQRRFMAAVEAGLKTKPQLLKDVPRKEASSPSRAKIKKIGHKKTNDKSVSSQ